MNQDQILKTVKETIYESLPEDISIDLPLNQTSLDSLNLIDIELELINKLELDEDFHIDEEDSIVDIVGKVKAIYSGC